MLQTPVSVFIDTNIVIGSGYNFYSGNLGWLKQLHKLGIVNLFTSSIVLSEVASNINIDLKAASSEIRNSIKRHPCIKGLLGSKRFEFLFEDFREQGWDQFVLEQWTEFIRSTDCTVLNTENVSISAVLNDYFCANPPFEEKQVKKYEFPDAIIIKSLIVYMQNRNDKMFVITKDKGWVDAFVTYKNVIVVDDIIDILRNLYSDVDPKISKRIIDCINSSYKEITVRIEEFIIDCQKFDLEQDYDEITAIDVEKCGIEFVAIEAINDDYITVILQANVELVVSYDYTDYENSPYDSELNEYVYLNSVEVTEAYSSLTEIVAYLNISDNGEFEFDYFEFLEPFVLDDLSRI